MLKELPTCLQSLTKANFAGMYIQCKIEDTGVLYLLSDVGSLCSHNNIMLEQHLVHVASQAMLHLHIHVCWPYTGIFC